VSRSTSAHHHHHRHHHHQRVRIVTSNRDGAAVVLFVLASNRAQIHARCRESRTESGSGESGIGRGVTFVRRTRGTVGTALIARRLIPARSRVLVLLDRGEFAWKPDRSSTLSICRSIAAIPLSSPSSSREFCERSRRANALRHEAKGERRAPRRQRSRDRRKT